MTLWLGIPILGKLRINDFVSFIETSLKVSKNYLMDKCAQKYVAVFEELADLDLVLLFLD